MRRRRPPNRPTNRRRPALRLLTKLSEATAGLRRSHDFEGWSAVVATLVRELGFNRVPLDDEMPNRQHEFGEKLAAVLFDAARAERIGDVTPAKLSLQEFVEELTDLIERESLAPRRREEGCVRVLSAEQVRNLDIPYLFLAGLSENSFPKHRGDDCLYSERERRELNEAGLSLGHRTLRAQEELLMFYGIVSRARKRLVLTYPVVTTDGQPLSPSPFVAGLVELFDPLAFKTQLEEQLDPVPDPERVLSAADARVRGMFDALAGRPALFRALCEEPSLASAARNCLAAVEMNVQRFHTVGFTKFEGRLENPHNIEILSQRFSSEHEFSATQLEAYARCPFRFLMSQVLALEPPVAPDIDTDFGRRGTLVHDVLADLHRALFEARKTGDPRRETASGDEIAAGFQKLLGEKLGRRAPASQVHAALQRIEQRLLTEWGIVYGQQWDEYVAGLPRDGDFPPLPSRFETAFGSTTRGEAAVADESKPLVFGAGPAAVRVGGRIDRIDVGRVGGETVFTVIDYKTGRRASPKHDTLESGRKLQLVLYTLAVARLELVGAEAHPWQMGYWHIRETGFASEARGKRAKEGEPLPPVEAAVWDSLVQTLEHIIPRLAAGIRAGQFPVYNADPTCTSGCPYNTVCRVTQIRALPGEMQKVWNRFPRNANRLRKIHGHRPRTPTAACGDRGTKRVSVVLSAGAGCGKTSVLTQRFLSHLDPRSGTAELSNLVVITFTERAAREMRERIRGECLARLRTATAEQADHWLSIVREMDSARISTIHSFCSSLLRSHAVEAGIDPGFSLLNETLGPSYLQQAVKAGVHELLAADDADVAELVFEFGLGRACELLATFVQERYRIDFAEWEQKTAQTLAEEWDGRWHRVFIPNLLREAAESKLAERLIELLDEHVPANAVMQERRLVLLENVRHLADDEIDVQTRLELLKQNARVQGGGTKKDWESEEIYTDVKETLTDFRTLIEKLQKQLDFDPEYALRGAEIGLCALRAAAKVGAVYDAQKVEAALLDFDDLLLRARNLLRDHDDVRRRVQAGISLLMVDEFQDTDPIQDDIVRLLCGAALLDGRLFVVGDAKQSIYRFRRAEPRVFHELRQKVPPAGRLPLSVNFRSQPQVLGLVNAVFDGALGVEYEALEANASQMSPLPSVEFLFSVAGPDEAGPEDDVDQTAPARRRREGDWIARRITHLLGDKVPRVRYRNPETGEPDLRPAQRRDVVILFRAMSDVRYYEEALRKYGLDYYVVGGRAFFAQQEVFDVVNLCQYLDDIDDEAALVGVLRSPFFCLSDDAIFALGPHPGRALGVPRSFERAGAPEADCDPPAHLSEEQKTQVRLAGQVLCRLHEEKDRLPISRLLTLAIDLTGYDASLLTEFLGVRKLANLRKLIDLARQFDQSGLFTLADFVDRLKDAVADETHEPLAATHPESSDVIRLMSIHQSKGLEFPVVIVADSDRAGRSQPPLAHFDHELGPLVSLPEKFGEKRDHPGMRMFRQSEKEEDLAESRRLFYVAATRAADLLILSANLKQAGKAANPWLQLLSERFDLLTGQPRQAPAAGGISILVKYSKSLPKILVHQTAPQAMDIAHDPAPRGPALQSFRELVDEAVPDPLPETLQSFPPDLSLRRRFNVSEIEMADADVRAASSHSERPQSGLKATRPHAASTAPMDLSAAEQLGTLVHAALERIDFQNPQEITALVGACCGGSGAKVDERTRGAARTCLENVLASPLGAELAAARQIHREIEFLLAFPPRRNGAPKEPEEIAIADSRIISGTIDCLFESAQGKWTIVDYKTGVRDAKTPPSEILAEYEIQLGLYALAVEQLLKRLPDRIELVFMQQGVERVVFEPDESLLDEIVARVHHVVQGFFI